jgi:glutathione S-transferase
MIQVFGSPMSGGTRKVLAALLETNAPYDFKVVDFAQREHKSRLAVLSAPAHAVPGYSHPRKRHAA